MKYYKILNPIHLEVIGYFFPLLTLISFNNIKIYVTPKIPGRYVKHMNESLSTKGKEHKPTYRAPNNQGKTMYGSRESFTFVERMIALEPKFHKQPQNNQQYYTKGILRHLFKIKEIFCLKKSLFILVILY